jgi:hypothetical protein
MWGIGQILERKTGASTITKRLYETIWLAVYGIYSLDFVPKSTDENSNQNNHHVILKSVRHWRLQNERDILLRYQSKTPYMRPVIDTIEEPPTLILK